MAGEIVVVLTVLGVVWRSFECGINNRSVNDFRVLTARRLGFRVDFLNFLGASVSSSSDSVVVLGVVVVVVVVVDVVVDRRRGLLVVVVLIFLGATVVVVLVVVVLAGFLISLEDRWDLLRKLGELSESGSSKREDLLTDRPEAIIGDFVVEVVDVRADRDEVEVISEQQDSRETWDEVDLDDPSLDEDERTAWRDLLSIRPLRAASFIFFLLFSGLITIINGVLGIGVVVVVTGETEVDDPD